MKTEFTQIITERAERILKRYADTFDLFDLGHFYMAGNALNNISGRVTDIDLFVINDYRYTKFCDRVWESEGVINSIARTKNAITLKEQDRIFQVCSYAKESLEELIHSFDYTHIQVGVEIRLAPVSFDPNISEYRVHKVFYTDAYVTAQAAGNSQYVGSDYPLSSLLRASKYFKYGELSRSKLIQAVILSVSDVAVRGFKDYDDFKDQLDAVDLGLLPEDMKDMEHDALMELFEALRKDV